MMPVIINPFVNACSFSSSGSKEALNMGKRKTVPNLLVALLPLLLSLAAAAQSIANGSDLAPSFGSVTTPRPLNPSADTTNPSARATQTLNPYLGSTPEGKVVDGELKLSLDDAVARGLRFNLGLID